MATPVAKFLVEFGRNDHTPSFKAQDELVLPQDFETGEAILEQQLEDAFARGLGEGREKAKAEFDLEIAAAHAKFADEMASAQARWALELGERIHEQITASLQQFRNSVANSVARILTPFLTSVLIQQAVDELVETLTAMTAQTPIGKIKISGPEDLVQALQHRMAGGNFEVEYTSSELNEVTIIANQTTVVTQLQTWIDRFSDSLR
jgi:hypothetical protein